MKPTKRPVKGRGITKGGNPGLDDPIVSPAVKKTRDYKDLMESLQKREPTLRPGRPAR